MSLMEKPFKQLIIATFSDSQEASDGLASLKILSRERILRVIHATAISRDRRNRLHIRRMGGLGTKLKPISNSLQAFADMVEADTSILIAAVEHIWLAGVEAATRRSRTEGLISAYITDSVRERLDKSPTDVVFSVFHDGQEMQPPSSESTDPAAQEFGDSWVRLMDRGVTIQKTIISNRGVVERRIGITEDGFTANDTPVEWQRRLQESKLSFEQLEQRARRYIDEISDDPEARYRLSAHFYGLYGRGTSTAGYGNSEIAFTRWEIERGVLNPLDDPSKPGSPWWREVNGHFLYTARLAMLVEKAGLQDVELPLSLQYWLDFFHNPTAQGWYRAHNRGIVEGYIRYAHLARDEDPYEHVFMNQVLYRVIYASAMVSGRTILGPIGQISSHPALPAVDMIVKVPHFYPAHYPMQLVDKLRVLHYGRSLRSIAVRILDERLIFPGLDNLYQWQAEWLGTPELTGFSAQNTPCYPPKQGGQTNAQ